MIFHRRIIALSAACLAFAGPAFCQPATWPTRPITLIVPQTAGGASDVLGRIWATYMSNSLKVPVVVENRPGANGVIASSYVAKQPSDGYTFLLAGISYLAFNPYTYKSLPYDPEKDFEGVALLVNTPFLLVASPQSGIKTIEDISARAKNNPGGINFSSAGRGNSTHLVMEMIGQRLGVKLTHVPYNGSAKGLTAVMSGEVQLMSDVLSTAAVQAKAGKVVPVAAISSKRAVGLEDVPTINELGLKDFPQPGWYAIVAPAQTPRAIIERMNAETQKFLSDPSVRAKLDSLNYEPLGGNAELVKNWARRDGKVWAPVIKRLGISND